MTEQFLTINLGDIIIAIALVVAYLKLRKEINGTDDIVAEDYDELDARITELSEETPRAKVNDNNEAVITLPNGTEIYNWDLKSNNKK
ncbi:MAG: hypothetical protein AAF717_00380 [Bacteroidota bacterium]